MEDKIRDLKDLKCFVVEYKCKEAIPGRHIVVAYNANDAINLFFKNWDNKYQAYEVNISKEELENIEVREWCDYWEGMIGRF